LPRGQLPAWTDLRVIRDVDAPLFVVLRRLGKYRGKIFGVTKLLVKVCSRPASRALATLRPINLET
jgi:hypothetical protein